MHVAPLRRGELLITASVLHFSSERNSGLLRPSLNIHVNSYQATLRRTSNYLRGGKHGGAGRGGGGRHQNKWSRPISRHFLRPLTQTISSAPRERLLLSSRGVNHPRGDTTLSLSLSPYSSSSSSVHSNAQTMVLLNDGEVRARGTRSSAAAGEPITEPR